jgi:protein arginine N-methyltransferase 3
VVVFAQQDIDTNRTTVPDLDFMSDFVLQPTASNSSTRIRAFLTWFDTFFSPDSSIKGQAPLKRDTEYIKYDDEAYKVDLSAAGGSDAREVSFTTGPRGKATHWKQVAFLLKEPVEVPAGELQAVAGVCR